MKKLLSTLATVAVTTGAATGLLKGNIIANTNEKVQMNDNVAATNLDSIITVTNLGQIKMASKAPTKSELLAAIKVANKGATDLTTSDFILEDISTPTSVVIIGIGNYTGEVFLQYEKQLTDISSIITTTNLGTITFTGVVPTKTELLTGIKNANEGASALTIDDFELEDSPLSGTVTVIGVEGYSGTVTLTFTQTDARTDISTIITTTALGTISTGGAAPNKSQILTAIKAVNPDATNLTNSNFGFDDIPSTTGATIYGIGDNFKGQVALTYTVE